MTNILSLSNTSGNPVTVPATASPATLATLTVGENNYQAIELSSMVTITTAGTSTAQNIDIDFRIDGVVSKTFALNTLAAVHVRPTNLQWMVKVNKKCTLTMTLKASSGGAADANSNVVVNSFYAEGHF